MSISALTDAVGFVRSHPEMFFGSKPGPIPCVQHLVAQVLALGAADVWVERRQNWWVVTSNFDWFLPDQTAGDQTRKLVPLPEIGANASRVEVVLIAFAEAVSTRVGAQPWEQLAGCELPDPAGGVTEAGRAVAFCFRAQ